MGPVSHQRVSGIGIAMNNLGTRSSVIDQNEDLTPVQHIKVGNLTKSVIENPPKNKQEGSSGEIHDGEERGQQDDQKINVTH